MVANQYGPNFKIFFNLISYQRIKMAQNPERDVPTLSATVNWFDRGKRAVFMSFNDSRNGFAPCQYFKNYGQSSVAAGV